MTEAAILQNQVHITSMGAAIKLTKITVMIVNSITARPWVVAA